MRQMMGMPPTREEPAFGRALEPRLRPAPERPDYPPVHTRVLWVRVAALVAALVAAFVGGFLAAPTGGSGGRVEQLEAELAQAEENIAALQEQLRDQETAAMPSPSPAVSETPRAPRGGADTTDVRDAGAEAAATDEIVGRTYTVRPGDTLINLAARFYGDVDYDDFLAEVNGIADTTELPVGFELEIPDKPANP